MNEVEKMYRNAHVYPKVYGDITKETFENKVFNMADMCNKAFTAEKQIELIKWLSDTDYYIHNIYKTIDTKEYFIDNYYYDMQTDKFEETLAGLVNKLWQDLTEEERKQIRGILE